MASTEPYLYCSEIPFSQYVGQMFLYTIPTTCLTLIVHAVLACILYPCYYMLSRGRLLALWS